MSLEKSKSLYEPKNIFQSENQQNSSSDYKSQLSQKATHFSQEKFPVNMSKQISEQFGSKPKYSEKQYEDKEMSQQIEDDYDGWSQSNSNEQPCFSKAKSHISESSMKQNFNFRFLKVEDILKRIPNQVKLTNQLLCLDNEDQVLSVLRYFKWNKSTIEDQWFQDQQQLMINIGLEFDSNLIQKNPQIMSSTSNKNNNTCLICYSEFDNDEFEAQSLVCEHQYCKTCWSYYLKDKVQSDGLTCVFSKCPQNGCNVVVPHSFFLNHLKDENSLDEKYLQKYINWHCKQFTDQNKYIKWCPRKGCDYFAEISDACMLQTLKCECGKQFCIQCSNEDHIPVPCSQVKEWLLKEKSDSENVLWIQANTKQCPQCKALIEKNQGCNHMVCQKCKFNFCWLCLTDWSKHGQTTGGYYACNIYDNLIKQDAGLKSLEQKKHDAKNELMIYAFYYERYDNHHKAKQICEKQIEQINTNIMKLTQEKNRSINDFQFFKEAAFEIIQCRQVLKWSYVLGYFLKIQNSQGLEFLQFQQSMLEEQCEKTHQELEKDQSCYDDKNKFENYKSGLINLTNILRNQYQKFAESLMNE